MNKKFLFSGVVLIILSVVFFGLHFFIKPPPSTLEIQLRSKPAVMPIAYKVYGNPEALDGRFWLVKAVLTNKGEQNIKNLKISYRIPDYIDWTTPNIYKEVLPGQTVVDRFYPKFPSKIINVMNPTPANVEIRISYNNGRETVEEIRKVPFQIRGRNEFIYTDIPVEEIADITDAYDNSYLLAAFVTPEDPIIKYFTQQLQQKVLKGTAAGAFTTPDEILRFMEAVYNFEVSTGMVYAGTLGLPEKIGNTYSIVQRIRLPREVLTGGAGLCVELSTLFCSIAISAGLKCGIFLTSKHAWPAILSGDRPYPIEATMIGGKGLGKVGSFQEAIRAGEQNFQIWATGGNERFGIQIGFLDINQLQSEGIRPPELQDDVALRKKVDELFAKLEGGGREDKIIIVKDQQQGTDGGTVITTTTQPPVVGFSIYKDPAGIFSISIPSDWIVTEYPVPEVSYFVLGASSPDSLNALEVYVLEGFVSTDDAINEIVTLIESAGGQVTYRKVGKRKIGNRQFVKYTGTTVFPGARTSWEAYFTVTGTGVVGFSVGATNTSLNAQRRIIDRIIKSFRVYE